VNAPVEQKVNVSEISQLSNEQKREEQKQNDAKEILNKQRSRHIIVQKQNFTHADQKTMSTQDKLKNTISQEKFLKEKEENELQDWGSELEDEQVQGLVDLKTSYLRNP